MRSVKGFSLVEVLIAMLIIAISMVASLEFYVFCQRNFITQSRLRLMAAYFAQETMERWYWLDMKYLADVENKSDPLPSEGEFADELRTKHDGTRTLSITTCPDDDYKIIKTRVSWL